VWSSPLEPTGLVYIPGETRRASAAFGNPGHGVSIVRFKGASLPLEEKRNAFTGLLEAAHIHMAMEIPNTEEEFESLQTLAALNKPDIDVWRIIVPPASAAALMLELKPPLWTADWAGGLLWLGMKDSTAAVHDIAARYEAHATLVRAGEATRNAVAPFPPLTPERLALTKSVKAAFDPLGLFNPGRMYPDV
jgi:glycolate oxidase FAD binding subunit